MGNKNMLVTSVILTVAAVGQIVSAIVFYDPEGNPNLINTGWGVMMLSAIFGWLPIFTFRRKGKVEGRGYIRTSRRTTWGKNVARDPDIALRIGDAEYPVRATFIVDEAERARIVAAFEEKYGSNPILNFLRGSDPPIMRLDPR